MYFVIRNNEYVNLTGYTFRDFMKGKIKNLKKLRSPIGKITLQQYLLKLD